MPDLIFSSAAEIARRIRAREVSSAEVVEACLRRIAQVNPTLNAVVVLAADAHEQARKADAALHAGELGDPSTACR